MDALDLRFEKTGRNVIVAVKLDIIEGCGDAMPAGHSSGLRTADMRQGSNDYVSEAQLFIDDQPMKTTSSRRAFSTPTLEPGQAYYYVLRAEVVRDGKTYELTRRVIVRAGEQIKASFKDLETASPAYIAKANGNR